MKRAVLCLALLQVACDAPERPTAAAPSAAVPAPAAREYFSDVAIQTGVDFVHENGMTGEYYFPEIMGSGLALTDYDGDGDLDLYVIQGAALSTTAVLAGPGNRLYRNELVPTGELRFSDVSDAAGVAHPGYGMGVAVADWDNDGDQDFYVTNFGPNVLYRNNGDGTFSDVTSRKEKRDDSWSTSASFVDYDRDGDLDLYVANYVAFIVSNNVACTGHAGQRDYCDPTAYAPQRDRLWRNDDGVFVDVSEQSRIARGFANGLGVTVADFNNDKWPDIYVANDQTANILWINQHDGTFEDQALILGCAYNADGAAEASMGVTAGDYDGDGDEDLFMTHLGTETNTIYRNNGDGSFVDVSDVTGLSVPSLGYTGFGAAWFDVNNDGRLDLFSANGAVQIEPAQMAQESYPYLQRNQLFLNDVSGRFIDVSSRAGEAMQVARVSRGAAFGDIDNDGDTDIAVSNNHGRLALLINEELASAWLRVRVRGMESNRDGIGARVAVLTGDDPSRWRRVHTDGSYLSASDPRVTFGLAGIKGVDGVLVHWPSGVQESWNIRQIDQEITLVEGGGNCPGTSIPSIICRVEAGRLE